MGKTNISWTDFTFSPWHGCMKVSPGCTNCYMETLLKRFGKDEFFGPAKTHARRVFGPKHWAAPLKWDREAEIEGVRRRVFCASMGDVFEDHPQLPPLRDRLWALIERTPNLDWLLLTKRPENIAHMLPQGYWRNIWLGTSTEDQKRAGERVPVLLRYRDQVPVLFLSVEPQIGPVDLDRWLWRHLPYEKWPAAAFEASECVTRSRLLDWVIVGGESGPRHRPFELDWARSLRDQCTAAAVAFHYKQFGGLHHAAGGCELDGREWKEFPTTRSRTLVEA